MTKKILVLGTSSGIGKACVEYFRSNGHTVDTVSRSQGATFVGNLTESAFRRQLIDSVDHDVVINSVGVLYRSPAEVAHINYGVAADLTLKLYDKLQSGSDIINISSISATLTMNHGMPNERIMYNSSKQGISDVCVALAKARRKDVRVVTLEPETVMPTDLAEITKKQIPPERYSNYNYDTFTPIQPSYIPEVINWIISQPRWINIGRMTILNNCKT
jgi:NADP-dependent 3-hydroxy acid dehydrogenase YdfG